MDRSFLKTKDRISFMIDMQGGGDVQNWTVVHMLTVCNCAKIIILFETDCSAQFFSLSSCIV